MYVAKLIGVCFGELWGQFEMQKIRGTVLGVLLITFILNFGNTVDAQQSEDSVESRYRAMFDAMYADPGDLDTTFDFARLAIAVGDFEAAIGALERMLLYDKDLPRVRLELGVLYFRLGSYAMSRSYLNAVAENENVPPEVMERVKKFIREIDRRQSRHRFSGMLYAGARYQTNANAGPGSSRIRVLGFDATLDDQFTEQDDFSGFLAGRVNYSFDFKMENDTSFDTDLSFYGSEQKDETQVNIALFVLRAGPRLSLNISDTSIAGMFLTRIAIRPYFVTDWMALHSDRYYQSFGGGVLLSSGLGSRLSADLDVKVIDRNYNDNSGSPNASTQNGVRSGGLLTFRYALGKRTQLTLGGEVERENTDLASSANWEYDVSFGVQRGINPPFQITRGPWYLNLTGAYVLTDYDEPDAIIDPGVTRQDREKRISLQVSVPLIDRLTLVTTGQYRDIGSNLPNFEYDDTAITVGALWIF